MGKYEGETSTATELVGRNKDGKGFKGDPDLDNTKGLALRDWWQERTKLADQRNRRQGRKRIRVADLEMGEGVSVRDPEERWRSGGGGGYMRGCPKEAMTRFGEISFRLMIISWANLSPAVAFRSPSATDIPFPATLISGVL